MKNRTGLQRWRLWSQAGFFILFVLAPPLDLLRFDLDLGYLFFLGAPWTLGIDPFIQGDIGPVGAVMNLVLRGFLPLLLVGGALIWTAWRFGRLYCGWLCPHFSVVEMINRLMLRAGGKPSLWERNPLPQRQPDGSRLTADRRYWPLTVLAAIFFAFLWAVVLLTYLISPTEIYHNLFHASLTPNQFRFIAVGTVLLFIEFMFARHLFCRFGCAVGLFQSLAWMGNDRAMVVGFDKRRAALCSNCNNACDNVCPMRLKPRSIKRRMFTCTECAQCISACEQVQNIPVTNRFSWHLARIFSPMAALQRLAIYRILRVVAPCHERKSTHHIPGKPIRDGYKNPQAGLLQWVSGEDALPVVKGRPHPKQAPTTQQSSTQDLKWKSR